MMTSIFAERERNIIVSAASDMIRSKLIDSLKKLGFDVSRIEIDVDYNCIKVLIKMNALSGDENKNDALMLSKFICS